MKTVAIHQPEFLPWLGFCAKARSADLLILLDTVQFRRNYFQNRNRIRTADGWNWITMPVRHPQLVPIEDAAIDTEAPIVRKNPKRFEQAYAHAPFFDRYFSTIRHLLAAPPPRLADLNEALITSIFEALGIATP